MIFRLLLAGILSLAAWPSTVQWNFDGGSLQQAQRIAPDHFRLHVDGQSDQDHRNRQASWYYFQVNCTPSVTVTLDIVGLTGEYNYQPNRGAITGDTPPVISYDQKTWKHVDDAEYDPAEPRLRLRIRPLRARFWIAHTPPYTDVHLAQLRKAVLKHSQAREQIIGRSIEGRNLLLWTVGNPRAARVVWMMFRQHAWESGSSWVGDGAVRALLDEPALREGICWKILPTADPDGIAHGGVRFNRRGYDLNRNWDVNNPTLMPEISAQRAAIKASAGRVQLFLTLHNTETAEYLEGPPGPLADSFFQALRDKTTFDPSRPFAPLIANTEKGRANVMQALVTDLKVPAFLMEQRVAFNPRLGHLPVIPDRTAFGRQLVTVIHRVVVSTSIPL